MCLSHIHSYPKRPEEDVGSSGARVTGSCLTWVTSAILKTFGRTASTQLLRHLSSPAKDFLNAWVSFFLGRQNGISERCLPPVLANFPSCKAGVRCLGNVKSLQNSLQAITSEWNIATAKTGFNSFSFYFKVSRVVLRFPWCGLLRPLLRVLLTRVRTGCSVVDFNTMMKATCKPIKLSTSFVTYPKLFHSTLWGSVRNTAKITINQKQSKPTNLNKTFRLRISYFSAGASVCMWGIVRPL